MSVVSGSAVPTHYLILKIGPGHSNSSGHQMHFGLTLP